MARESEYGEAPAIVGDSHGYVRVLCANGDTWTVDTADVEDWQGVVLRRAVWAGMERYDAARRVRGIAEAYDVEVSDEIELAAAPLSMRAVRARQALIGSRSGGAR